MRNAVLWDASAILAYLDADDTHHSEAVDVVTTLTTERRNACITNYIEAEAHALILRELGRAAAHQWLLDRPLEVIRATPSDEERARTLLLRHRDKDWSYCDAIAFAVMDAWRISSAFSFDRHFRQYGRFTILGPSR